MFRKYLIILFFPVITLQAWGQQTENETNRLTAFVQMIDITSRRVPYEKVSLHFDNNCYYQGDHIWFKCYITSTRNQLEVLSKTLYVELLNPGGEIIDKRILKIENGQCHGNFTINQLPFYSGFYEVRAYTKYMLNFGDGVIFFRLLPVFDKPSTEGDFQERNMLGYGRYGPSGNFPMKRKPPVREKAVNMRFFPEGGRLIQGIASRIAFEATDEAGNPIDVTGVVKQQIIVNGQLTMKEEEIPITTLHEGKGVFTYTPVGYRRNGIVIIEYAGKKYDFDLPESLPQGVAMEVDNMSRTDSIGIVLRKNADTPAEMLGVTITNGGRLQNFAFVWMDDPEIRISMDKTRLATGVSQVVLFNSKGDILCDRLIFNYNMDDRLIISAKSGKQTYMPYERVDVEMTVTDRQLNPVQTTFSVSVRDGANGIENNHTVLTDLLLMSEIKGYVRNPSYYFEDKNNTKETRPATSLHLDLLLMVQGWRRYSWKQMAGVDKFELKYFPEQGIETIGTVLTSRLFSKLKPKPDVDVTLVIYLLGKDGEQGSGAAAYFITDEHGQFSFTSGVEGRWNMYLTASEKGKEKNYPIVIDRLFSPEPGRYRYADLKVNPAEIEKESVDYVDFQAEADSLTIASQDSLGVLGTDEKMQYLAEVTVTAKRTRERDIYRNRSTAITYYDAASALENMYDRTGFSGNNIYELMQNMNKDFMSRWSGGKEIFLYKNKRPLFVIDYVPVNLDNPAWTEMPVINPNAIKSIYINETTTAKCNYANSKDLTCMNLDDLLSCVVFIETLPEEEIMADPVKGVRQTRLDGYSLIEEFYSPDYSALPTEPDYRRTLYWNPMVTSDDSGKANLHFYNNSRTENFNISAETTTSQGLIGILQE